MMTIRPLLIKNGKHLDRIQVEQKLAPLESYLQLEAKRIHRLTLDWANWDDTYNFIDGEKSTYIKSNLQMGTFDNNEIDYMFFYDRSHSFIYGKGIEAIPPELKDVVQNLIVAFEEQDSAFITKTTKGLAYVGITDIYRSSGKSDSNGKLAIIQYIDDTFLTTLENALSLEIKEISLVKRNSLPPHEIQLLNGQEMEGSIFIPMTTKNEFAQFILSEDRDYFIKNSKSWIDLFLLFLLMILFLVGLIYILMDRLIVSRVTHLSLQLKAINNSKDGSHRLIHSRKNKDEIFLLERTTNELLASLEHSHKEIEHLAYHDYLTDLPNRFKLKMEFDEMTLTDTSFALFFLDLDGFKYINDGYGHTVGDMLLKEVAVRLTTSIIHDHSVISRFGGDEFVILVQQLSQLELEKLGDLIIEVISEPYDINGIIARITTSIGISRMPEDSETFDQLIQHADQAMYDSKRNGKNQFSFYLKHIESPSE